MKSYPKDVGHAIIYETENGQLHREDGPAVIHKNSGAGGKFWWFYDKRIYVKNNKEFLLVIKQLNRLKVFW